MKASPRSSPMTESLDGDPPSERVGFCQHCSCWRAEKLSQNKLPTWRESTFQRSNSFPSSFFSTCLHLLFTLDDPHCYWTIKQMFISWVNVKWKPLLVELLLIFGFLPNPQLPRKRGLGFVAGLVVASVYWGLLSVGHWPWELKTTLGSLMAVLYITKSIEKGKMRCLLQPW